jgi:hypothetical protein
MKVLDPLTITNVCFSARNILYVPSVDQENLESVFFQDLEERNPVHPCGFHRNRIDATPSEPPDSGEEFCCEC